MPNTCIGMCSMKNRTEPFNNYKAIILLSVSQYSERNRWSKNEINSFWCSFYFRKRLEDYDLERWEKTNTGYFRTEGSRIYNFLNSQINSDQ